MSASVLSRRARRSVLAGAGFLLAWQLGVLAGIPRQTEVVLALYGFVLHTVFGKAYSLVPSYFGRRLAVPLAPTVQLPLTVLGTVGLGLATLDLGPPGVATGAAVAWAVGVAVFLAALLWSVRDNLTGRETATGDANAHREPVDRAANAFVPVALVYLVAGTYETLALAAGVPTLFGGHASRSSHLLAAGTAAMLLFAVGFRLLPRFLVASPPRALVAVVLPAGALGPALLAASLGADGPALRVGAVLQATAVVGFAAAYAVLFVRSDRRRVGFYGVLAGVAGGVLGVVLGLTFAFGATPTGAVVAHLRLNLLGFLGLTIVGVAYQFYPPAIGSFPGASDRTALASILALAGGLALEVVGLLGGPSVVASGGAALAALGAGLYAYLLAGLFRER